MYQPAFTINELKDVTQGEVVTELKSYEGEYSVSTDTRTIQPNNVYLALKGQNFDGHNFIQNAYDNGVRVFVTETNMPKLKDAIFIKVEDTLEAYLKIASFHRQKMNAKIIAVTGSSGKTTTKEMIYSIFNANFKTKKSIKNHNNEIGMCQTLLSIEPKDEYCIVEMGMRAKGEIHLLAKYAQPDFAVITNVGTAHIGILGSKENIAQAKCEITDFFNENNILFAFDDELIKNNLPKRNFYKNFYSLDEVKITKKTEDYARFLYDNFEFKINETADFNLLNALVGIKLGQHEKLNNMQIQNGLDEFKNVENRNEITKLENGAMIISDCYNANPDSVCASIKAICETYKSKDIIIVLGDMLELGEFEEIYHKKVGELVDKLNVKYFISVGNLAKIATESIKNISSKAFNSTQEATDFLKTIIDANSLVLLKASRGMYFEKILEMIREK